jgi:arabinofuranan 3-O-arabinosyltransferase
MLRSLGVSHIIVRHDLIADPDLPAHADAKTISAALNRLVGDRQVARYRVADLYHVPFVTGPINAYRWLATADRAESADLPQLPPDAAFTDSVHAGTDAASRRLVAPTGSSRFNLPEAGRYRLTHETKQELPLRVGLRRGPRGTTLTLQDANRIAVDGHGLPARRPMRLATFAGTDSAALDVNGELRPVPKDGSLVTPQIGTTIAVYGREQNAIAGGFGPLKDCNHSDQRTPEQAGLSREIPEPGWIRLRAVAHSACVSVPVHAGAPAYRVRFSYRSPTGHPIRFCLWQQGPDLCAGLRAAPPSRGWRTYDGRAHIAPGTHALSLYLYADGPGDRDAAVEYRDVRVDEARVIAATRVTDTGSPPVTRSLAAGRHMITMSPQPPPVRLGKYSSLQDCNARIGREALHSMSVRHTGPQSVQLAATADTACVTAPIPGPVASNYRITFDYRTLSGLSARICVWQVGPATCAPLPDLAISRDWRTISATFQPERRTRKLQIFLYADGQAQPRTITEYRDLALTVVSPETVIVADAAQPAPAPHLKVHSEGQARYDIDVRGADGAFVLTLAESYADGWHLEGLPKGWQARHLPVDGYANGWVVTGHGDAHIRLVYRPEDWMRPALSLYGLPLLCIFSSFVGLYRRIRICSPRFKLGVEKYLKSISRSRLLR